MLWCKYFEIGEVTRRMAFSPAIVEKKVTVFLSWIINTNVGVSLFTPDQNLLFKNDYLQVLLINIHMSTYLRRTQGLSGVFLRFYTSGLNLFVTQRFTMSHHPSIHPSNTAEGRFQNSFSLLKEWLNSSTWLPLLAVAKWALPRLIRRSRSCETGERN